MNYYLKFLNLFVRKYYKRIFVSMILAFISMLVIMVNPVLSRYLIDDILISRNMSLLDMILIIIICVVILNSIMHLIYSYMLNKVFLNIGYDLKTEMFNYISKLDVLVNNTMSVGEFSFRLFNDTENIKTSFGQAVFGGIFNVLLIIIIVIYMFIMNKRLTIFVVVIQALQIIVTLLFQNKIRRITYERKSISEKTMNRTMEVLTSIYLLKACGNEKDEADSFNSKIKLVTEKALKESTLNLIFTELSSLVNSIVSFGVIWYGGILVINKFITLGELTAFMIVGNMLSSPLSSVTSVILSFQDVLSSTKRIFDVFNLKNSVQNNSNIQTNISGDIDVENLSFSYDNKKLALNNLSFNIKEKSIVSIIGKSGSGKTTLCLLIARFFDPIKGKIKINEMDLKEVNLEWYRKNVGMVLQNKFLFSGTIRENILLGKKDASQEEIINAAKLANAHEFISSLPDGYWSEVGENGKRLSGGQAQRIALARMFLQKPKLVILDEPTSFIDLESEEYIKDSIKKLSENSTIIIITHKLKTARLASKIIVLDNGEIIQEGSHDELIAASGEYLKLYKTLLT